MEGIHGESSLNATVGSGFPEASYRRTRGNVSLICQFYICRFDFFIVYAKVGQWCLCWVAKWIQYWANVLLGWTQKYVMGLEED